MNLRNRILIITIPINIVTITCIYLIVENNAYNTVEDLTNIHTHALLNSAMLSIKNQYNSLEYHREHITTLRKKERKQIVEMAKLIVSQYYDDFKKGELSEQEAKKQAIRILNDLKYDNGNGYIWINNTERPIPRIINHPIFPELNGAIPDQPMFYTTSDSTMNNFLQAVIICEKYGGGFFEYRWKKPDQENELSAKPDKPKTSYVELFEPWQWVLGTGVYLEDIDEDVDEKLNAILIELKQTMGRMKLGETGYFFIFDSNKELLLHPFFDNNSPESVRALHTDAPYDEVMAAAKTEEKSYEYMWYSPLNDITKKKYNKKVFVEYFEPLDWYVCASFYYEELAEPGILLGRKILFISAIFIIISFIIMLYLSNSLIKPLNQLMVFVAKIPHNFLNIDLTRIPSFRAHEANALGKVITEMLISIKDQQSNLIKEKNKAIESKVQLRDSEEKYRMLFESSNDAILLIQGNKIISCNQKALELFACNKQFVIGSTLSILSPEFQPDGQRSTEKENKILSRVSKGNSHFFEWKHIRPNGELFDCSISLNLVVLKNEKYTQATLRDITEHKKAEKEILKLNLELESRVNERTKQLQQANNDLEAFVYSVSHDLRAPLRHIDGFVHLLEKAVNTDNIKVQNYINKIFLSSKNMSTMITELLEFSRLGRAELKTTMVNLSEIINEVIMQLKPDYIDRNIEWNIQKLPEVNGDPALLKIAFENLISNAIKYTAKKEQAVIEIGHKENCPDGRVCIFIKDNGAGFDITYKDKLFRVFQRLHKNDDFEGIGIGLANVKQIINKHNGEIDADSKIGQWATFYITLQISNNQ